MQEGIARDGEREHVLTELATPLEADAHNVSTGRLTFCGRRFAEALEIVLAHKACSSARHGGVIERIAQPPHTVARKHGAVRAICYTVDIRPRKRVEARGEARRRVKDLLHGNAAR